jgi:hypothetical protein
LRAVDWHIDGVLSLSLRWFLYAVQCLGLLGILDAVIFLPEVASLPDLQLRDLLLVSLATFGRSLLPAFLLFL